MNLNIVDIFCRNKNWLVIFLLSILFSGCASQKDALNVKEYTAEDVKPLTASEFTLGPSDVIEVQVWRHTELNKKIQVDPYGKISYPFIGEISVTGLSVKQLKDVLTQGLSKYYVDPVIEINVSAVQSQKISVLGEVFKPGVFALTKPTDILEAVALSGGFTHDAKEESVLVIRGNKNDPELIRLDLKSAMNYADLKQNIRLQNGDIVYVPVTFIADASRFFRYIRDIMYPIVILGHDVTVSY